MEVGVHLPQVSPGGDPVAVDRVFETVDVARELGFPAVSANDHLAYHLPWLDGPTLLAAVARAAGDMELATTVALPAVRGPAQVAAMFATLAALAPGRVVAGVGPGSSAADLALAGVPFEDRWARFDDSLVVLRALIRGEPPLAEWASRLGTASVMAPAEPIPVWVASWGSDSGLRRVARLGDGWLASAYNTTPAEFAAGRAKLMDELQRRGRDPDGFPTAVATMWTWIDDDASSAERVLTEVVAPVVRRDPDALRDRVCVGTPARCAELLAEYAAAGCRRVYVWPLQDETAQLRRLAEEVLPRLER